MSLPVSQYEALLAEVRSLRRQAQHVQQLADPLLIHNSNNEEIDKLNLPSENVLMDHNTIQSEDVSNHSDSSSSNNVDKQIWNSDPTNFGLNHLKMEIPSVMSFASSSGIPIDRHQLTLDLTTSKNSSNKLDAKVDMVYSLLSMLGGQEHADMGETLLALSTNPESCLAMRHSGCIPLLVQMVQSDKNSETRKNASKALHNLINSQPDEKIKKREMRILKLLENVSCYIEALKNELDYVSEEDGDKHPVQNIAHLMKLSFDEGHRHAICNLGGISIIAKLVEMEHYFHGSTTCETQCILMRRYACMALTNLTFGDSVNKALLCSYKDFIKALVVQLESPSDELRQVTASVLRNLSWRADSTSKDILKEVGSVSALMKAAMLLDNKENTLKSILSALWNLSAHCTENKAEICSVNGALDFLVQLLSYKSTSNSLAIIENSGGILRNISSQIAVRDDYREILRERNCLQILLVHLKSPSLTIVSNACGTLWNLSAKNQTDQELLWQLGAPTMLRSLNHSKHKMIAMGSSATLKNLLSAKPDQPLLPHIDSTALSLDLPILPTLGVRKKKALLKDLDQNLSETFDNIETSTDMKKLKNKQNEISSSGNIDEKLNDEPSTSSLPYDKEKYTSTPITNNNKNINNEGDSSENESSYISKRFSADYSIKFNDTINNYVDIKHGSDNVSQLWVNEKEESDIEEQLNEKKESLIPKYKNESIQSTELNVTSEKKGEVKGLNGDEIKEEITEKQDFGKEKQLSLDVQCTSKQEESNVEQKYQLNDNFSDEEKCLPEMNRSEENPEMTPEIYSISNNCLVFDDKNGDKLQRSCNDSSNILDTRMLDPEAMIESLDRFTAELVSQASSHLQNKDSLYKSEWTESNEPSFPSISIDAPNVVSFDTTDGKKNEMTESILIAMEATKIAEAFKEASNKSVSVNSLISLELDNIQPPSNLNSLSNSIIGFDSKPNSPKLLRKKSLPSNIMVKRALLPHTFGYDEESSNGLYFTTSSSLTNLTTANDLNSIKDIENINPPSLLNEISDMYNSLADIATNEICNETEIFESCITHINDSIFQTENDITEFSDAQSITPDQSDINSSSTSSENSKRQKNKLLTSKQRRVLAKERYKTYTIAAEMLLKDKTPTQEDNLPQTDDEKLKLSPKERRLRDRSRFETQVLEVSQLQEIEQQNEESCESDISPKQSPSRSRISVRKNFLLNRLNNKDRFKTQTINESKFKNETEHLLVEEEANKVLQTLNETKINDELIECETLSLVSNEDDNTTTIEQNPRNSLLYRTYRKSLINKKNIPIIESTNISSDEDETKNRKPKIVKPQLQTKNDKIEETPKGIRGRRKPLYTKPVVTKSIRPTKILQNASPSKMNVKPKSILQEKFANRPPSGSIKKPLERQGTFTKDDLNEIKTKIPSRSGIPKASPSKSSNIPRSSLIKSSSSDRTTKLPNPIYLRSTSADSRVNITRQIQNSSSSQSLKQNNGAIKKIQNQRSNTNIEITTKKQVTSKIASIWKKIEESKKKCTTNKNDTKKWIEAVPNGENSSIDTRIIDEGDN